MKIIFPTGHFYPSRGAHARHSLEMARAFTKLLGDDFKFIIGRTQQEELLRDTNYIESKYSLALRKSKPEPFFIFFGCSYFFFGKEI